MNEAALGMSFLVLGFLSFKHCELFLHSDNLDEP